MSEPQVERQVSASVPPRAQFRLGNLALWLPLCLVNGAAAAWLAYGVQKHFAPLGLFPVLVGLGIGVTLAGLMRLVQVANTRTILLGAVIASLLAVVGQHYFSYREQRETAIRQAAQFRMAAQAHPDLVQGTPPQPASGLFEYLRWQAMRGRPIWGDVVARGGMAWASWAFDGILVLAAALLVITPASLQPYCNQCRTWFSTVRRGRLGPSAAEEVARTLRMEAPEGIREGGYRIVHCQGGCGVAGFEICWELNNGNRDVKRIWVSPEDRAKLETLIAPTPDPRPLNPDP
jgi:hypothetical protein